MAGALRRTQNSGYIFNMHHTGNPSVSAAIFKYLFRKEVYLVGKKIRIEKGIFLPTSIILLGVIFFGFLFVTVALVVKTLLLISAQHCPLAHRCF